MKAGMAAPSLVMAVLAGLGLRAAADGVSVVNPLPGGPAPDPFVVYDGDSGYYYALFTEAEADGYTSSTLSISRSRHVATLRQSESRVLYVTNAADRVYGCIWAPEMHRAADGKWYVWTSGAVDPERRHKRVIVLQSKTADPFDGFTFKGHPDPDLDAIDPTVTTFPDGRMYACLSPYDDKSQWLRIRELASPWSYGEKWADIARAELDWERVPPHYDDRPIVEGPFFLRSPDGRRLFIVYSANGCWSDDYALGILEYQGGDPCRAAAWKKHPKAVFKKGNGVFGTGHASFFKSPDGTETWVAYHSLAHSNPQGTPLPRNMNVQRISFDATGFPVLGVPVPHGRPMAPPSGERTTGVWSVGAVNGAPGLLHDGQPVEPSFFWQWHGEREDITAFARGGTRLFSLFVDTPETRNHWTADGTPDLTFYQTNLDHCVEWAPGGSFLPRVFYTPPAWWLEAHPEERVDYAVKTDACAQVSYASERFWREGGAAFAKTVKALEARYGDRLMGVHAACGPWGEHFGWDANEECCHDFRLRPGSDVSEPMRRRFSDYLRKKHGNDVSRLRQAFGDPAVTFDTVHVPTADERRRLTDGVWRDPARGRLVPDYFECHQETTVRMIENFCRAAKEATGGKKLTCVFYGYTQDEPWGVECDHRAVSKLLARPWVDMVSAPHTYNRREPGGDAAMRQYLASTALHGKLFIDESDDRTHLETLKPKGERAPYPGYFATNSTESVHVLFREFGMAVTHGVGQWYMDIQKDNFRDPAIVQACSRARRWMCEAMNRPRGHHSEVAVVSNPESEFYMGYRLTGGNYVGTALYDCQLPAFYRAGAPFDWYLIDDLEAVEKGPAKVVVFLDCQFMTSRHRAAVERLKSRGRTLVFLHAPGYVCEERLSKEAMEAVIGFKVKGVGGAPLLARDLATKAEYGWAARQEGLFAPVMTDGLTPIACGVEELKDIPVIAEKDFGTWKSCFAGVPGLSPDILRGLYRSAGVHVYEDSGAVLSANASWVMLHTRTAGRYEIRLPHVCRRVTDVVSERVVGADADRLTLDMDAKRTAVLLLDRTE